MDPLSSSRATGANHIRKRRRKSRNSLNGEHTRSTSEGGRRVRKLHDVSRQSSTGSSAVSLDVRCACQYFQCDSLLPERTNPAGSRPSSRTSNLMPQIGDHDYEPINAPPVTTVYTVPPLSKLADTVLHTHNTGSGTSLERQYLRVPSNLEIGVQNDVKEVTPTPNELDYSIGAEEMQSRTPNMFGSRPECNLNTKQADYSLINELPKKKDSTKDKKTKSLPKSQGQGTFRTHAGKLKTRLQNIKAPTFRLPERKKKTTVERLTVSAPKNPEKRTFSFPKMPERPKISFPSFSLPRKSTAKRSLRERQFSTESNVGDSKKKIFDFKTYPRIFDRSKKDKSDSKSATEFATVPRINRTKNQTGSRWKQLFSDVKSVEQREQSPKGEEVEEKPDIKRIPLHSDREDSVERRMELNNRYIDDIDLDDDYEKENIEVHSAALFGNEYPKRWKHGSFHEGPTQDQSDYNRGKYKITDLDNYAPEELTLLNEKFEVKRRQDTQSSGSSSEHRRGVLEEIDSDEFFLREKGISQDNIEVGLYLSSEIRDAFRTPVNALSQMQKHYYDNDYDVDVSDRSDSIHEVSKRKPIKKPKRKKTPHVSHEEINDDKDSINTEPEEYPKSYLDSNKFSTPSRPRRKSKKSKKSENIIPFQETIPLEEPLEAGQAIQKAYKESESSAEDLQQMYENEHMKGIEQPDIQILNHNQAAEYDDMKNVEDLIKIYTENPTVPKRKYKSLKSLTPSEPDSITGEINIGKDFLQENAETYRADHEYMIPTPEEPPVRPERTRSRTRSQSRATAQLDEESISNGAELLAAEEQIPCIEEPCVRDMRDAMGYAIIDKQKRDPPLPPRRKRSIKSNKSANETKFFTVPRSLNDTPPTRPLRNYSTLGQSRPPSKVSTPNLTDEDKENIDITQYIEILDDEQSRDLHSGEVIQKMKDRPLPAPPRPPRKAKDATKEVLCDITNGEHDSYISSPVDEAEVSTQTEPLPDDFECEEHIQGVNDKIITPSIRSSDYPTGTDPSFIQRRVQVPTYFEHEETITHAALIVQPVGDAQILPSSYISNTFPTQTSDSPLQEKVFPIIIEKTKSTFNEDIEDETSDIPEDFKKMKAPSEVISASAPLVHEKCNEAASVTIITDPNAEIHLLKAQKLQVGDLDVNRLTVNELQASKILVTQIDGVSLQVTDINSKLGNLVLNGIELPTHLIQELLNKLQSASSVQYSEDFNSPSENIDASEPTTILPVELKEDTLSESNEIVAESTEQRSTNIEVSQELEKSIETTEECENTHYESDALTETQSVQNEEQVSEQKKTPIEEVELYLDEPPQRPPRKLSKAEKSFQNYGDSENNEEINDEMQNQTEPLGNSETELKPEEDPPPRPPQPENISYSDYTRSQPPASFYALRSRSSDMYDEDIPLPPRRRRHYKPPVSRSSSDEAPQVPRRHKIASEPSISQLTGQLVTVSANSADRLLKRLITHITNNVLNNADGKQDLHVVMILLLVLIAGLILLGFGDGKTVHYHHWEYFNPPTDL